MDVPGIGPGSAETDRAGAAREMALSAAANAPAVAAGEATLQSDSVAALLRELSQADLTRLLGVLEKGSLPQEAEHLETLRQAVFAAVAEQNPDRAMEQLKRLAMLDPRRAETLAFEPALASIRSDIERLLGQLTAVAKLNAEGRLAEASRVLEPGAGKEAAPHEIRPETFLLIATRLIEAGGLANYVRSAAASGALLDQSLWAPMPVAEPAPARMDLVARSRIPLGFLFLGWLALGMVGVAVCWWSHYDRPQAVFEVWGGVLLVLVCLGAWHRMWISR